MAINLNGTTPAAPASTVNSAWQSDVSGNVSVNVPLSATILPPVDTTGLTGNVGTSLLFAALASGRYRVSAYLIVTVVGSVSSTLPKITVTWTDPDNNTSQTQDLTATNAGNLLTTLTQGSVFFSAKASTNIQYSTSGYASSAAGMTYALHLDIEKMF
jgi:hypothetical protein